MLPNRMQLSRTVEDQLKKLKSQTGITPNVAARVAFFRSVESGFKFDIGSEYKLDGVMLLDKFTWLGRSQYIIELLLIKMYPTITAKDLQSAWASHVEHGISALRNHKTKFDLVDSILS